MSRVQYFLYELRIRKPGPTAGPMIMIAIASSAETAKLCQMPYGKSVWNFDGSTRRQRLARRRAPPRQRVP